MKELKCSLHVEVSPNASLNVPHSFLVCSLVAAALEGRESMPITMAWVAREGPALELVSVCNVDVAHPNLV